MIMKDIQYNEFGEVIEVNGLTTGQHLGAPMQDALGTAENNKANATERNTINRCGNQVDDLQAKVNATSVNGVKADQNGNVSIEIPQSDLSQNDPTQPDYVKNRTHYAAINVVNYRSDVITENYTSVPATYGALSTTFGSPGSPKMPEGKFLLFKLGDVTHKITHIPTKVTNTKYSENIVLENGVTIKYTLSNTNLSGRLDTKRLYCRVYPVSVDETVYLGKDFNIALVEDVLKPLDEMFIPNSIPKVQSATVGQTVVVKAVDENGKPTEWEAAVVGGGSNKIVIRNNSVWNEENGSMDYSFSSDVSYEDALRILMDDPTTAVLITIEVDGDTTYTSAENAYEISYTEGNEYFGIRFEGVTLSWTINGIEIMPE